MTFGLASIGFARKKDGARDGMAILDDLKDRPYQMRSRLDRRRKNTPLRLLKALWNVPIRENDGILKVDDRRSGHDRRSGVDRRSADIRHVTPIFDDREDPSHVIRSKMDRRKDRISFDSLKVPFLDSEGNLVAADRRGGLDRRKN